MTTASTTPESRPNEDERENDDRAVGLRHETKRSSDQLKEAEAHRLERMERERASEQGSPPGAPDERWSG